MTTTQCPSCMKHVPDDEWIPSAGTMIVCPHCRRIICRSTGDGIFDNISGGDPSNYGILGDAILGK